MERIDDASRSTVERGEVSTSFAEDGAGLGETRAGRFIGAIFRFLFKQAWISKNEIRRSANERSKRRTRIVSLWEL